MPTDPPVPLLSDLVLGGVLDAELAALAWLLLEDGVPVLVAGPGGRGADVLVEALVAALPAERHPEAPAATGVPRLVRVPGSLGVSTPPGPLRTALSRTSGRSGLVAGLDAADLADVLAVLRAQGLGDDEISFLGVVLVLADRIGADTNPAAGELRVRVVAAHYLRPVARDAGGHVQRLGPAVLAAWDDRRAGFDHFAWGIYPELAARTGRRAGDLELEHRERTARLRRASPGDPAHG